MAAVASQSVWTSLVSGATDRFSKARTDTAQAWSVVKDNIGRLGSTLETNVEILSDNIVEQFGVSSAEDTTALDDQPTPESFIHILNEDVVLRIFYYVASEDPTHVHRAGAVCKQWLAWTNREYLWAGLWHENVGSWTTIQGGSKKTYFDPSKQIWSSVMSLLDMPEEENQNNGVIDTNEPTWKQKYLRQEGRNCKEYEEAVREQCEHLRNLPSGEVAFNRVSSWDRINQSVSNNLPFELSMPFSQRVFRVPIFGGGMEVPLNSKHLLYTMMWDDKTPFKMSKLHPGKGGIGSGVEFCVNQTRLNLAAMYCKDKEKDVRASWKKFFKTAHAFVYVLDLANISDARKQLQDLLSDTEEPLLIYGIGTRGDYKDINTASIELGVSEMKRPWCIQMLDTENFTDQLYSGMHWLTNEL